MRHGQLVAIYMTILHNNVPYSVMDKCAIGNLLPFVKLWKVQPAKIGRDKASIYSWSSRISTLYITLYWLARDLIIVQLEKFNFPSVLHELQAFHDSAYLHSLV